MGTYMKVSLADSMTQSFQELPNSFATTMEQLVIISTQPCLVKLLVEVAIHTKVWRGTVSNKAMANPMGIQNFVDISMAMIISIRLTPLRLLLGVHISTRVWPVMLVSDVMSDSILANSR